MTDEKRLTDADMAAIDEAITEAEKERATGVTGTANAEHWPCVEPELLRRGADELRAKRALLRELVEEEGCPWRETNGVTVCAFCGAHSRSDFLSEPEYDHAAECWWLRLEREVENAQR